MSTLRTILICKFYFELAAGISTETATLDGNKIPASVSVALNLGYAF